MRPTFRPRTAAILLAATLALAACDEAQFDFTYTFSFTAPLNLEGRFAEPSGSVATTDLAPLFLDAAVDVDMVASNPELQKYTDRNKWKKLTISSVTYTVKNNNATARVPELQVVVGPPGLGGASDPEAILIARIPAIDPGETRTGEALVVREFTSLVANEVFDLSYGLGAGTSLSVSAGETVPGGSLEIDVQVILLMKADEV